MVPSDATMFAGSQPPQLDSDLLEDKDHIHYWVWRPTFPNTVGYTHRHCLVYICGLIQMRRWNCLHVFSYTLSLAYLHLWYLHSVPCFFIFCVFFGGARNYPTRVDIRHVQLLADPLCLGHIRPLCMCTDVK